MAKYVKTDFEILHWSILREKNNCKAKQITSCKTKIFASRDIHLEKSGFGTMEGIYTCNFLL